MNEMYDFTSTITFITLIKTLFNYNPLRPSITYDSFKLHIFKQQVMTIIIITYIFIMNF